MFRAALALAFVGFMLLRPAAADVDASTRLFGSWRLVSFQLKVIGEDGPPMETFGAHPFGRIILPTTT